MGGGGYAPPPPKTPAPADMAPHARSAAYQEVEEEVGLGGRADDDAFDGDFGEDAPSMLSLDRDEAVDAKKAEVTRGLSRREAPEKLKQAKVASPYLLTLGNLARELEAQARGRVDTAAIRLLRQRLTEWVEDLRSVGNAHDLATAVEQLVQRLSAALALASDLAAEALAIATELQTLAGGAPPPRAPSGRAAFWK